MLTLGASGTNVVIKADDGLGHVGLSQPLEVLAPWASPAPPLLSWQHNIDSDQMEFLWAEPGFRLQVQTNPIGTGLSTNWYDVPGATSSPVLLTPDPTQPAVFYRLIGP